MKNSFFPRWTEKHKGVIAPDERLPFGQTALMGLQHAITMFGATILGPLLMGFDPNIAILMSGVATLVFFVFTRGQVPSYLGSSFAFIASVSMATGYQTGSFGNNPKIGVALGGIVACGVLFFCIGFLIKVIGTKWLESLMPPVVTGAVVSVIGLNLAGAAVIAAKASNSDAWYTLMTIACIAYMGVFTGGMARRLLVLVGMLLATVLYGIFVNGLGWGTDGVNGSHPIDFSKVAEAAWFGFPQFNTPVFELSAVTLIAPMAIILLAENLGHLRAVSGMTGRNINPYLGSAFMGNGLSTVLAGLVGGTGTTTYAENIGVMAVTKIYSTLAFVFAAIFAIILGFLPKTGALIQCIPAPVLAGVSIVVFGLIAVSGAKIWLDNKVDFTRNHNLLIAGITLILGAGDFSLSIGGVKLGGIGVATFGAMILHALLKRGVRERV